MKRLTNVIDSYPQFSKDGKLLLFQSNLLENLVLRSESIVYGVFSPVWLRR